MSDQIFNDTGIDYRQPRNALADKWGPHIIALGYTAIPDVLLTNLAALKMHPPDFLVLCHLLRHWWTADQLPYPSKSKLARDMHTSEKNIQRIIGRLVALGLIRRIERKREHDRNDSNVYDLAPLIAKLKPLAIAEGHSRAMEAGKKHPQPVEKSKHGTQARPPVEPIPWTYKPPTVQRPPVEKI
jgi:hypothetical protein